MEFGQLLQVVRVLILIAAICYGAYSCISSMRRLNSIRPALGTGLMTRAVRLGVGVAAIPALGVGLVVAFMRPLVDAMITSFGFFLALIFAVIVFTLLRVETSRSNPCPSCAFERDESGPAELRYCADCGAIYCSRCNSESKCLKCDKWGVQALRG